MKLSENIKSKSFKVNDKVCRLCLFVVAKEFPLVLLPTVCLFVFFSFTLIQQNSCHCNGSLVVTRGVEAFPNAVGSCF